MDLFNRPPTIAEDTVIYTLYPPPGTDKSGVTSLSTLIATHVREALLPANHIWHRDAFDLRVIDDSHSSNSNSNTKIYLQGTVRVGDCVDDEWCIVWLLYQISQKFDVVISVYDSDGEFLLIEAAEHLPNWVTPENAENRVWIYQSRLHLIPLEHTSPPSRSHERRKLPRHGDSDNEDDALGNNETFLSADLAVQLVRTPDVDTVAADGVQSVVQNKIGRYPRALAQHIQRAKAFLPSDIVLALSENPSLIQKAVEAFYTRDALQLRVVSKMSRFPPSTGIYAGVTMTRTAFAQLMGQKFHPPKVFGRWTELEGSPEWRWKDIGMKVACGFEMLYAENRSKPGTGMSANSPESVDALQDVLKRDAAYQSYIENLKRAGYFPSDLLEGSQEWKERESRAVAMWVELRKDENVNRPTFTSLVDDSVARALPQKDKVIHQSSSEIAEDSIEWLNVSPDELEKTLSTMGKREGMDVDLPESKIEEVDGDPETAEAQKHADRLGKFAAKVEKFVEGEGDLDGARFDDDLLSDDEDLSLSDPPSSESDDDEDPTISQARRKEAMDKLVPPLDPSEYGKLPPADTPAPSTSQKTGKVTMETETRTLPNGETRKIRQPILMRDKFDGVDSDDETSSEEDEAKRAVDELREEDESDDEAPQVVGGVSHDIDINMEEEEEDFIKFSRQALGISDTMWNDIVKERQERGAFVPAGSSDAKESATPDLSDAIESKLKGKTNKFLDAIKEDRPQPQPTANATGAPQARNPNLDSFEAVMEAMDAELQKTRQARKEAKAAASTPSAQAKGKGRAVAFNVIDQEDDDEDDDEAAMDAELRAALKREEDDEVEEAGMDYNLIKNFLESFKSQSGLAGPVGNLAGRLDPSWTLPRDDEVS